MHRHVRVPFSRSGLRQKSIACGPGICLVVYLDFANYNDYVISKKDYCFSFGTIQNLESLISEGLLMDWPIGRTAADPWRVVGEAS